MPGEDYFIIQVYAAQVAFRGQIWDKIKGLVVASQINLNHRNLDNRAMRALQRTRNVEKNRSQSLGLAPNLINLVPAVMPNITISIDFILDKENQIAKLGTLINSDSFTSALSLAPGATAVAKTVAQLADRVIQTFIPAEESKPLLAFSGDFNISTKQLLDGYYIILGSKDDQNPLPAPTAKFEVRDGGLLVDGQPATQWSYVILDVRLVPTRPRDLSDGAVWSSKLREAEDEADRVVMNPRATDSEREQVWNKCLKLIEEAQTLLRADDNYLPKDAKNITVATMYNCQKVLAKDRSDTRSAKSVEHGSAWSPNLSSALSTLDLPANYDLNAEMDKYADQLHKARQKLRAAGIK
jgi:hypothetical protein